MRGALGMPHGMPSDAFGVLERLRRPRTPDGVLGLRPRPAAQASDSVRRVASTTPDEEALHLGLGEVRSTSTPSKRGSTPVGGGARDPEHRGGGVPPCLHVRFSLLPARWRASSASCPRGTWRQVAGRSSASFQPRGADGMPLQMEMEMRLFVEGQLVEEALVKAGKSSLSPSPPPRTPSTKPGRALYGLDFQWPFSSYDQVYSVIYASG